MEANKETHLERLAILMADGWSPLTPLLRNPGQDALVRETLVHVKEPGYSDSAGGGLRGLRAAPSERLLEAVRNAYGVDLRGDAVDLGGSSNLNLAVRAGSDRLVLRVYRPHVLEERLGAIQDVRQHLSKRIPCGGLLPTENGGTWIEVDGRLVEVELFVDHDGNMNTWARLEAGMALLASMHDALRELRPVPAARAPRFANYIAREEVVAGTRLGCARIRSWAHPELDRAAQAAEELADAVAAIERRGSSSLPTQLVHGDYWDNNVLFTGEDVAFVTDFDYMGFRPRVDDLALTLYFSCLQFPESPVSDDQLRQLRRLVDAYDNASEHRLTAQERLALAPAIARQPLWSIGGWVASLDDENAAREHAKAATSEVYWALGVMRELERWQEALGAGDDSR